MRTEQRKVQHLLKSIIILGFDSATRLYNSIANTVVAININEY